MPLRVGLNQWLVEAHTKSCWSMLNCIGRKNRPTNLQTIVYTVYCTRFINQVKAGHRC